MSFLYYVLIVAVVYLSAGCASYRNVSVLVRSKETGKPIPGVKVATVYSPEPFSFASRRQDRVLTDQRGIALLRANYLRREPTLLGPAEFPFSPSYCIGADGFMPASHYPSPNDTNRLLARKPAEIPTEPDIIINVTTEQGNRNKPVKMCDQQSVPEQFFDDLGVAWEWLTSPFRPARPID